MFPVTTGSPYTRMWVPILAYAPCTPPAGAHYLQHVDGTAFIGFADLELADKLWVLSHQHVHEAIDLRRDRREGRL